MRKKSNTHIKHTKPRTHSCPSVGLVGWWVGGWVVGWLVWVGGLVGLSVRTHSCPSVGLVGGWVGWVWVGGLVCLCLPHLLQDAWTNRSEIFRVCSQDHWPVWGRVLRTYWCPQTFQRRTAKYNFVTAQFDRFF